MFGLSKRQLAIGAVGVVGIVAVGYSLSRRKSTVTANRKR
jgi:hypothetical protein